MWPKTFSALNFKRSLRVLIVFSVLLSSTTYKLNYEGRVRAQGLDNDLVEVEMVGPVSVGTNVQHGSYILAADVVEAQVSIDLVDLEHTFVICTDDASITSPDGSQIMCRLTGVDQLTISRYAQEARPIKVEYQVIEYRLANVQHGVTLLASNTLKIDVPLAEIVDLSRSLVLQTSSCASSSPDDFACGLVATELSTDGTAVHLERATSRGHEASVSWSVIEFQDGSHVQYGRSVIGAASELNEAGERMTQFAIEPVDGRRAAVFAIYTGSDVDLYGRPRWRLRNNGLECTSFCNQVEVLVNHATTSQLEVSFQVVEFADFTETTHFNDLELVGDKLYSFSPAIDRSRSFILASSSIDSGDTGFDHYGNIRVNFGQHGGVIDYGVGEGMGPVMVEVSVVEMPNNWVDVSLGENFTFNESDYPSGVDSARLKVVGSDVLVRLYNSTQQRAVVNSEVEIADTGSESQSAEIMIGVASGLYDGDDYVVQVFNRVGTHGELTTASLILIQSDLVIPGVSVTPTPGTVGIGNLVQNSYRFFLDNDELTPIDPWGSINLPENTAVTLMPYTNDPPTTDREIRLRVNLIGLNDQLDGSNQKFKIQYKEGTDSSCSAGIWQDVGVDTAWEFAQSSVVDGNRVVPILSTSDVGGLYARSNPTIRLGFGWLAGQDIEFDFHLVGTNAANATRYSFRIVEESGDLLADYRFCPSITTAPNTSTLLRHGNVFSDETEAGFYWAD